MTQPRDRSRFLPVCRRDMVDRGWDQVDFVYVVGDAYVDHSSFGMAIISRLLEARGFKVGILCQPDWTDPESVCEFGEPRLGFLVSAGNMDSMVNHYTVASNHRSTDAYSPGGKMGLRPDRACVVYGNLIRRAFRHAPIILGGIEASLRRLAHYDYWCNSMRRSVLLDSAADLLIYGMGEHQIVEVAEALDAGLSVRDITFIDGTVYKTKSLEHVYDAVELPGWEAVRQGGEAYARSFAVQYANTDPFSGKRLVEPYGEHEFVVQNPPSAPLSAEELDAVYRLPYARAWHPDYDAAGGIPALSEVRFSLTSNRGCFGECAFCALTFHQGRIVQARSHESLIEEARELAAEPDFKGYIHDVGGPTADFRAPACDKQLKSGACPGKRCLAPKPCKRLVADHGDYLQLLRRIRALPGVKKVFVRSGIRFDYVMADGAHGREFLDELAQHHVSGQLRVAPEHVSDAVLRVMGKPSHEVYERFVREFQRATEAAGKEQYVVPYLMSSHPGSGLAEAVELAEYCRDMGFNPQQVQDFYPTPSTLATVMYATGLDPRTMEPVYVAKSRLEKALQRALIQYRDPKNRDLVEEALRRAGRTDLVGFGPKCLVRPKRPGDKDAPGKRAASGKGKGAGGGKDKGATRGKAKDGGRSGSGGKDARTAKGAPSIKGGAVGASKASGKGRRADAASARGSFKASSPKPQARRTKPPRANGHKGGIR